ncbi:hypothetical protein M5D96_003529, partial [Drosophila gunungcola]
VTMQSPNRTREDSSFRSSSIRNKHETPPEKFKSAGQRNLQVLNVERFLAVRGNACWPAFDTKATRKRWTNEPQVLGKLLASVCKWVCKWVKTEVQLRSPTPNRSGNPRLR